MQRRPARSRWEDFVWEPWSVIESDEPAGAPRLLVEKDGVAQWLHPGFELDIHRDEIEGYYTNVSSGAPSVFILWRMEGEDAATAQGIPAQVTASLEEAGRWMDGGHSVDRVAMPPLVFAWLGEYVEKNYKPEPPQPKRKPRSFIHPKDRVN